MHHQRACRKEPARGSPLGRYAGRPRLTPGLKFETRPIVRTLARCPAARRLRTKATLPGLAVSTDATWQAEIDQPSQELGMRRMSDTPHLSDTEPPPKQWTPLISSDGSGKVSEWVRNGVTLRMSSRRRRSRYWRAAVGRWCRSPASWGSRPRSAIRQLSGAERP